MPRKPALPSALNMPEELPADGHAQTQRELEVMGELVQANQGDRDEVNRLAGKVQMAKAIEGLLTAYSTAELAKIKEHKLYRALVGKTFTTPDGEVIAVDTWSGFCFSLGMSHQKVDEDLRNLVAFGEAALERLQRAGCSIRDFRALRRLPEDVRERAKQIDDPEELRELLEDSEAEKARLVQEHSAEAEAKDAVIARNQRTITRLQDQLEVRRYGSLKEAAEGLWEDSQAICARVNQLSESAADLLYASADEGPISPTRKMCAAAFAYVVRHCMATAQRMGVEWDIDQELSPEWLRQVAGEPAEPAESTATVTPLRARDRGAA